MPLNYEQEQHSLDWYRDRLGLITGSRVGVLMKKGRAKDEVFSETAKKYIYQLAGERALNKAFVDDDENFATFLEQTISQTKAMRFGTEQESSARDLYSRITHRDVREVGLCHHSELDCFASSPDGIINDDDVCGCLEIKCPTLQTFTMYATEIHDNASLLAVNSEYYYQCQSHMACTGTSFCDFVVFCPFVSKPMHIVRIQRDDEAIATIIERVKLADELIAEKLQTINLKAA